MTGSLTVYYNTGFNGVDIPGSPEVLELAPKKVYPNIYYTREDIDKPYFDVADNYENLKNVDYLVYTTTSGSSSYYFCVPSSLTKGVTRLSCDLDALLTMGGAKNLNYSSGWQERGHIKKEDDVLFSNLASENWVPTRPLYVAHVGEFGKKIEGVTYPSDVNLVMCSANLSVLGTSGEWTQDVIEGVVNGEEDPVMWFPAMPSVTEESSFKVYDYNDEEFRSYSLPGTGAFSLATTYQGTSVINRGLKKLYSAGQLQLQTSYTVPGEYLEPIQEGLYNPVYSTENPGQVSDIRGVHSILSASSMPFEYSVNGYTVKNKKVFSTYRQYVITNLGSSDISMKQAEDLYNPNTQNAFPAILLWSDPTSTGKPFARFQYIKDNPIQYADAVKGLQWANNQICLSGASGSLWNSINSAYNNSTLIRQEGLNRINASYAAQQAGIAASTLSLQNKTGAVTDALGFVGAMGGIGSGYSPSKEQAKNIGAYNLTKGLAAIGTIGNYAVDQTAQIQQLDLQTKQLQSTYNQAQTNSDAALAQIQQSINENKIGLIQNNNIVTPTLLFTPEQNLGLYGYNYFVLYEIRKTDEDLKSEDEYYQRFGYNGLHRPLTKDCFNTREYYTYVQAFNINIKSEFGLRVRSKAIAQLNSGVRVWNVLPDASYYDLN